MSTSHSTPRRVVEALATLAAGMTFAASPASAGDATFGPGQEVGAGHPASVAVGHFNSDGRPDLAVANHVDHKVSVRIAGSGGGYVPAPDLSVGKDPTAVVAADFNADGLDDLAMANRSNQHLSVYAAVGDGTFVQKPDVDLGWRPAALVVGDFNGDNSEDLAVATFGDFYDAAVSVLLGAGDGTFTKGGEESVPAGELAVGDFNEDKIEDLVIGPPHFFTDVTVGAVLLGTGGGELEPGEVFTLPGPADGRGSWAVGDFNSDGHQDVAAAIIDEDVVSVRLGAGDGKFGGGPDVSTGDGPTAVAVGDLNSDGNEDLVVTHVDTGSVAVRLGDGAGGFAAPADVPVGRGPRQVAITDLDLDGNEDLVVANQLDKSLSVRLGRGEPSLAGNLLVNGGFEGSTAAALHTRSPAIPGWESTGGMTYIRYGIPAGSFFPSRLSAPRWNGGQSLLWGGNSAPSGGITEASQTVDVSGSAAAIDAGRAAANLSADLGGALDVPDTMEVRADFLNEAGERLGALKIAPVTVDDRRRLTVLLRRSAAGAVPAGARGIRVTLISSDEDKTYSSATADNVRLSIDTLDAPAGGPDADGVAPAIRGVRLAPAAFAVARRATARSAARGTTIRYALSEPARVTLRLQRKAGRHYRLAGTLRRSGRQGVNRVAFSGRIGRRALPRGGYRLIVSAVDAAGNRSTARPKRFRIVR